MGRAELIRTYGSSSLCVRGATPFPWIRLDLLALCIPGINNVSRTIHAKEQDQHREERGIETELHSVLSATCRRVPSVLFAGEHAALWLHAFFLANIFLHKNHYVRSDYVVFFLILRAYKLCHNRVGGARKGNNNFVFIIKAFVFERIEFERLSNILEFIEL